MRQPACWILGAMAVCATLPACGPGRPAQSADAKPRATEPSAVEATSLLGRPLARPELAADLRAKQERLLAEAEAALGADTHDADALIWVGRRTAYLGRYREAIETFTRGVEQHPDDARFLRHRGHRYLTTRRLDLAVADLERAAELIRDRPDEVEPDGLPNERNVPTSTLNANVWYHLGLARYLSGDFEGAAAAYRESLAFSLNPDMLCATSHWLYMTLRRLGRADEARALLERVHDGMDVIENRDYWRLLLMYKGERDAQALLAEAGEAQPPGVGLATTAYGVGNWHLYNGNRQRAVEIFERIVATDAWAAFGYIAAEADLARLRQAGV